MENATAMLSCNSAEPAAGQPRRDTILLIEDDPGVARLERLSLERAGYQVASAPDAAQGLERVRQGHIDLIVLDQRLPGGISGLECYQQIKAAGHSFPAILVTGLCDEATLLQAIRAGVRDFVPKTTDYLTYLLPAITRVLKEVRTERELAESQALTRQALERQQELEREIAERRQAEEALRRSESRLRLALQAGHMGSWEWDLQTDRVIWSEGHYAILGLSPAMVEPSYQAWATRVHPNDLPGISEALSEAQRSHTPFRHEYRVVWPDGSVHWVEDRAQFVWNENGQPAQLVGVLADIDDRKKAEQALRESETRFRRLVESNIIGVIFADERIIYDANDAFLAMVGYAPAEVQAGRLEWRATVPPEDVEIAERALEQIRREGACAPFEIHCLRKDGCRVPVLIGAARIEEMPLRLVGFVLDLTERKQLEDELRHRADELAEAAHRKDEFLAMLAHELRNPLAPIRNAAEVLKLAGPNVAELRTAREMIGRQVAHMARLIDDLLDVSRLSRGKILLRKERVDLVNIVRDATQDYQGVLEQTGLRLGTVFPDGPLWVLGDPTRLAQIMGNILQNANKFTDTGGCVSVTLRAENDNTAVVSIRDSGIGMEPAMLRRIFDVFSQADRSLDRSRGGLGLGLALVKGLVDLHGGEVHAFSEGLGSGTEIVLRLPLNRTEPETQAHSEPTESGHRHRILIIEDHKDTADSSRLLLEMAGHEVEVDYSGHAGLRTAAKFHPDVILCDLGLPGGMDGYDVARALRGQPDFASTWLVAISGYGREEDQRQTREAGFDFHLTKPVDFYELRRVLASLSERSPHRNGSARSSTVDEQTPTPRPG